MNAHLARQYAKGHIDGSLMFFIVAILGAALLFGIDAELPIWVRFTCGILIGSFIVIGIFNMLFRYKGMGKNVSFDDKDDDKNKQDISINRDQEKSTGSLNHTLTSSDKDQKTED